MPGIMGKQKKSDWIQNNPTLIIVAAACVILLAGLLIIGLASGWFSGGERQTAATAPPAASPAPPAAASTKTAPTQPSKTPPVATPPSKTPPIATPPAKKPETTVLVNSALKAPAAAAPSSKKKEETKPATLLPLSDDVSKWKKEDYFRARRENHPRLPLAVTRLGEKFRGSDEAAQGLTELLKPVPLKDRVPSPAGASANGASAASPSKTPVHVQPMDPDISPEMAAYMASGAEETPDVAVVAQPNQPTPPDIKDTIHSQADLTRLVRIIIAALGENGTNRARATLEQVLAGSLTTDDDKAAVEATLDTLVSHPCEENNLLLLRVLLSPEEIRPTERQGAWPARDLRVKAFELIRSSASSEMRAKLAESLADRLVRLAPNDPIRVFLLAADPQNCSAQMVLYEKATLTKEMRTEIEKQLTAYSAMALGQMLELAHEGRNNQTRPNASYFSGADDPGPGSRGRSVLNTSAFNAAEIAPGVASLLWSEKWRNLIEPLLAKMPNLEKQPDLVLLAATIPQDSTRATLTRLLKKRWQDGPEVLDPDAIVNQITDPGLLVLVKLTTSRRQPKNGGGIGGMRSARSRSYFAPSANVRTGDAMNPAQRKEKAEQDWFDLSDNLATVWCQRFLAVAQARERAVAESGNLAADVAPKLPVDFELDSGTRVISSCSLYWPESAPPAMSDPKPNQLEIHYIRAEQTGRPKRVLSFYGRQAQSRDLHEMDDFVWVDGIRMVPQSGRRRSIDVRVSYSDGRPAEGMAKDDEEADLAVEILTVEIKDPLSRD